MSLPTTFLSEEITEYVRNTYGEDGLTNIIQGTLLVNDKELDKLIRDYWSVMGEERRYVFTIPIGRTNENARVYAEDALKKAITIWQESGLLKDLKWDHQSNDRLDKILGSNEKQVVKDE